MDAMGRLRRATGTTTPAITIGLVIQGTVWLHQGPNLNCARAIPTGYLRVLNGAERFTTTTTSIRELAP
jgi:hypothetical protein